MLDYLRFHCTVLCYIIITRFLLECYTCVLCICRLFCEHRLVTEREKQLLKKGHYNTLLDEQRLHDEELDRKVGSQAHLFGGLKQYSKVSVYNI